MSCSSTSYPALRRYSARKPATRPSSSLMEGISISARVSSKTFIDLDLRFERSCWRDSSNSAYVFAIFLRLFRVIRIAGLVQLVARPAASFIRNITDLYLRVTAGDSLRVVRGASAANTNRVHLGNVLGYCQQSGHRTKRAPAVVLIQPRSDNSDSRVGQIHAEIDDRGVEELDLVDADHLHPEDQVRSELIGVVYSDGVNASVVSRDDALIVEAIVDGGFEYL